MGLAEWGKVLVDAVVATAVRDRVLHHSHVVNIRDDSFRLREVRGPGLPSAGPPSRFPLPLTQGSTAVFT
jgi:hypothetical protein